MKLTNKRTGIVTVGLTGGSVGFFGAVNPKMSSSSSSDGAAAAFALVARTYAAVPNSGSSSDAAADTAGAVE